MKREKLTDAIIRAAEPSTSSYKLSDAGGLYLYVAPSGSRLWRLKYRLGGKERSITFGAYPDISLVAARDAREKAKVALKAGKDPGIDIREAAEQDEETSFEVIARQWHAIKKSTWTPVHAADVLNSLERDVFDDLGHMGIDQIRPRDLLAVLRKIEARPAVETAHRVRQRVASIFSFAIGMGLCETNPGLVVVGALAPVSSGKMPAVTTLEEARQVLQRADETPGHPLTKLALRLLALTVVRPGTLVSTPWPEFDVLDRKTPIWRVPAQRMKLKLSQKKLEARDHMVPLSRQAMEVIDALRTISGDTPNVFPNSRFHHKPMSENAMGYLLNRAGYHHQHVPHGWRATFSTVMNERNPVDGPIIEMILAHAPENKVSGAYNRARHIERRRELLQVWADMLMDGQAPLSEVVSAARR